MASDINPTLTPTKSLTNFRFWCQKVLPLVYDDSLSYYEVLGKMVVQLNDVIDDVNADIENVDTLKEAFLALQTYVNEFFADIDQLASYAERAEAAQTAANQSAINASESATNASASSLAAMNARDAAVTARQAAETSANTASTAATNANTKASEAAQSAITAQTAQASASQSATLAATDRSAAQTAANTATTKANEASESASSAEQNATNAADSAAEAVAAVDTVVNGLGNITKTIENTPIATTEDALPSLAKKLVVDIEPVQSGTGDPAPDNLRPITGWTGAKVTRAGKNLLAKPFLFRPSPSTLNDCFFIKAGTYTFSFGNIENATLWRFGVSMFDSQGNALNGDNYEPAKNMYYLSNVAMWYTAFDITSKELTLTFVEDCYTRIWFGSGNTTSDMVATEAQLELGSTATAYEPYQNETYDITFPSEAGTVYGGTLDVTSGVLTGYMAKITKNNTTGWVRSGAQGYYFEQNDLPTPDGTLHADVLCNKLKSAITGDNIVRRDSTYKTISIRTANSYASVAEMVADLGELEFVYPLGTPITYTLTPIEVATLLGTNNIWADTGNINTLEYFANAENYVTSQVNLAKALIAPILKDMIADTALVANDFRIVGNTLYRITGNVASGGTLTPNTNCVATTVGAILKSLLSA